MNSSGPRNSGFLAVALPPLVVIVVIGVGLMVYYRFYGASSSQYDSAMSNCVRDKTLWTSSSREKEEATVACAGSVPGGGR
ncbi:MAG TPA: hypothetical protein VFI23_08150 [Rhizomicrobium sp.]|nr:hypothetical protein [Rhizomicrobium sp.]